MEMELVQLMWRFNVMVNVRKTLAGDETMTKTLQFKRCLVK